MWPTKQPPSASWLLFFITLILLQAHIQSVAASPLPVPLAAARAISTPLKPSPDLLLPALKPRTPTTLPPKIQSKINKLTAPSTLTSTRRSLSHPLTKRRIDDPKNLRPGLIIGMAVGVAIGLICGLIALLGLFKPGCCCGRRSGKHNAAKMDTGKEKLIASGPGGGDETGLPGQAGGLPGVGMGESESAPLAVPVPMQTGYGYRDGYQGQGGASGSGRAYRGVEEEVEEERNVYEARPRGYV